ncbi:type VII secretion protein EccB [Nocardia abscessus]|uniref:type VII secretion protein EccB n=1 Tax=Nocardia abscessus TaxID=120957 RepID=UPI002457298B|nr:type VII secretion protein EccB [Nocardia abscessus]
MCPTALADPGHRPRGRCLFRVAAARPGGNDSKILIGKDSGQVYASIDGVVHPALNLASARLAVGDAAKAVIVKESELSKRPRGTLLGIPGAPSALGFDSSGKGRAWTVCDELKTDGSNALSSTVIAGDPSLGDKVGVLAQERALLVQGKESAYLIYANRRARVDMADRAITDALKIRGMTPRPISQGLLNAIPEVPPIERPKIDDPGGFPLKPVDNRRNGDVVRVSSVNQHYVVLRTGLQPISPLTADIIRNSNPTAGNYEITDFTRSNTDHVSTLPVQDHPETAPAIVDMKDQPVQCISWKPLPVASDKADGTGATGPSRRHRRERGPVLHQARIGNVRADHGYRTRQPAQGQHVLHRGHRSPIRHQGRRRAEGSRHGFRTRYAGTRAMADRRSAARRPRPRPSGGDGGPRRCGAGRQPGQATGAVQIAAAATPFRRGDQAHD